MASSPCETGEMFQGSWSFIGLESMQGPRGHPVERGVAPEKLPLFGPSQRASSWFSAVEIQSAPNAAFNISDGVVSIGCAYVAAKLSVLGISGINAHASVGAYGCRAEKIQWAGTFQ